MDMDMDMDSAVVTALRAALAAVELDPPDLGDAAATSTANALIAQTIPPHEGVQTTPCSSLRVEGPQAIHHGRRKGRRQ